MSDHHVCGEVPDLQAKDHRMETARWIEDFKPTADDLQNVRCRLVVQQDMGLIGSRRHASGNSTAVDVETLAQFGSQVEDIMRDHWSLRPRRGG